MTGSLPRASGQFHCSGKSARDCRTFVAAGILPCRSPPKCAPSKSSSRAAPRCWSRPSARCPQPAKGEVLIRVAAAGVNRPDILQRQGAYAPPPGTTDLPGLEVAGEIVAIGPETPRWKVGDRVTALVAGGGYAEYCVGPGPAMPAHPRQPDHDRGGRPAGDLLHGLDQRVRTRPPAGGRNLPGAWRVERHRHHRHPARQPLRLARVHDRRLCRKML